MRNWRFHFTLKHKRARVTCKVTVIGRSFDEAVLKVDEAWKVNPGIPDSSFTIVLNEIEEMA